MNLEHERLKEILAEAASKKTAAARAACLDAACQPELNNQGPRPSHCCSPATKA